MKGQMGQTMHENDESRQNLLWEMKRAKQEQITKYREEKLAKQIAKIEAEQAELAAKVAEKRQAEKAR